MSSSDDIMTGRLRYAIASRTKRIFFFRGGFVLARTHTGQKQRCLSSPRIFPSPAPRGRLPQTTSIRACSRETAEGNGPAFNVNRHARLIRGRKERERSKAESDGATTRLGRERGRDDRRDFPAENLTSPTTSVFPSEQIDLESLHHMQRNHTSTRSLQVVIRSSLSIDERLALGNAAGEFPEARHADLGAAEQPPWKRDGASCGQC
ncbi:hypothetical protein ALC53_05492 [Atta colombica]|uniref:Uncharacterized protein n=1 Tax=Atta colombica TaxID=520822 RepID=A0A195BIJ6_9HYME|nr:hypothetical protein ALC53_05492 [Atta colombica]